MVNMLDEFSKKLNLTHPPRSYDADTLVKKYEYLLSTLNQSQCIKTFLH